MDARAPSLRQALRAATEDIHQALHQAAPFARIADGRMDRTGYGELLIFLYRYHSAVAPLCTLGAAALEAPQLAAAHRARLAALESDLAYLERALPAPAEEASFADPDFCAGCLYTVQGSTLGGKVIARQLEHLLPDGAGRRFFLGGPEDGALWQLLCARLESHTGDRDRVEAGARDGFARFAAMLPS